MTEHPHFVTKNGRYFSFKNLNPFQSYLHVRTKFQKTYFQYLYNGRERGVRQIKAKHGTNLKKKRIVQFGKTK